MHLSTHLHCAVLRTLHCTSCNKVPTRLWYAAPCEGATNQISHSAPRSGSGPVPQCAGSGVSTLAVLCVRTQTNTHTRIHTCTHTRTHAHTHTQAHTRTHAHTHTQAHTRTHAHMHTHAGAGPVRLPLLWALGLWQAGSAHGRARCAGCAEPELEKAQLVELPHPGALRGGGVRSGGWAGARVEGGGRNAYARCTCVQVCRYVHVFEGTCGQVSK